MKLRYLINTKGKWWKPFYSLRKLRDFAREHKYPRNVTVRVDQCYRGGIYTAGELHLYID